MKLSKLVATSVFALSVCVLASDAEAFRGWHARHAGSYGGSYGSYGSYGGSYGGVTAVSYASGGSYGGSWGSGGSYGGGLFSRMHARHAARRAAHYAYASGGSWGSYGASYGGSYGSYGSTGRVAYSRPAYSNSYSTPVTYGSETVVDPEYSAGPSAYDDYQAPVENSVMERGDSTSVQRQGRAQLTVGLPAEARLYVNGRKTRTPGAERRFVSPDLKTGRSYVYELRVEADQDGELVTRTRTVHLRAGDNQRVAFDLEQAPPIETKVVLDVPEDASVTLAGVSSSMKGERRVFSTTKLAAGQVWEDYSIRVTATRDGRELTKEKTVSLKAGDTVELAFNFGELDLAAR